MVIQVGEKWCKATTTWKFWWNFLAKSLVFSRYPIFSPFQCTDAYKCYTFSESCGSRETKEIKISTSKFDLEARGILSSLWTQTGPWSDTASYEYNGHHPPPHSITVVIAGHTNRDGHHCYHCQIFFWRLGHIWWCERQCLAIRRRSFCTLCDNNCWLGPHRHNTRTLFRRTWTFSIIVDVLWLNQTYLVKWAYNVLQWGVVFLHFMLQ